MKAYRCGKENCNMVFDRPCKLLRHELLHTGIKSYRCPVEGCTKTYSTPSHLNRHMKSHRSATKVNPAYRCSHPGCQFIFDTRWGLRRHEKKHVNVNFCQPCSMFFNDTSNYLKHMNRHIMKSSQKCKTCGKSYTHTTRQKYLKHESRCRVSTFCEKRQSDDSFTCDRCGSHFIRKFTLRRHVVDCYSLTGSIFICAYPSCLNSFFYKNNLREHIKRRHLGMKHPCPVNGCGAEFRYKKSLKWHITLRHNPVKTAEHVLN